LAAGWAKAQSPRAFAAPLAPPSRLQVFTTEVAVSTFGAPEVAAASFMFVVEAVAPPFSFLAFMTKAQPSLVTEKARLQQTLPPSAWYDFKIINLAEFSTFYYFFGYYSLAK
jgi:hypothetical protein